MERSTESEVSQWISVSCFSKKANHRLHRQDSPPLTSVGQAHAIWFDCENAKVCLGVDSLNFSLFDPSRDFVEQITVRETIACSLAK